MKLEISKIIHVARKPNAKRLKEYSREKVDLNAKSVLWALKQYISLRSFRVTAMSISEKNGTSLQVVEGWRALICRRVHFQTDILSFQKWVRSCTNATFSVWIMLTGIYFVFIKKEWKLWNLWQFVFGISSPVFEWTSPFSIGAEVQKTVNSIPPRKKVQVGAIHLWLWRLIYVAALFSHLKWGTAFAITQKHDGGYVFHAAGNRFSKWKRLYPRGSQPTNTRPRAEHRSMEAECDRARW